MAAGIRPEAGKYFVLDPGSRHVGWSYMDAGAGGEILGAGRLSRTKGAYLGRVDELKLEVIDLIQDREVDYALIEVPSGGVHARHGGRGEGLSVYGYAVGAIRERVITRGIVVIDVPVAEWKSGQPKEKAIKVARRHYPPYAGMKDPGADIADGIALAVWYYEFKIRKG